jgi:hypothetical protein
MLGVGCEPRCFFILFYFLSCWNLLCLAGLVDKTSSGTAPFYCEVLYVAEVAPGLASECREGSGRYMYDTSFRVADNNGLSKFCSASPNTALLPWLYTALSMVSMI